MIKSKFFSQLITSSVIAIISLANQSFAKSRSLQDDARFSSSSLPSIPQKALIKRKSIKVRPSKIEVMRKKLPVMTSKKAKSVDLIIKKPIGSIGKQNKRLRKKVNHSSILKKNDHIKNLLNKTKKKLLSNKLPNRTTLKKRLAIKKAQRTSLTKKNSNNFKNLSLKNNKKTSLLLKKTLHKAIPAIKDHKKESIDYENYDTEYETDQAPYQIESDEYIKENQDILRNDLDIRYKNTDDIWSTYFKNIDTQYDNNTDQFYTPFSSYNPFTNYDSYTKPTNEHYTSYNYQAEIDTESEKAKAEAKARSDKINEEFEKARAEAKARSDKINEEFEKANAESKARSDKYNQSSYGSHTSSGKNNFQSNTRYTKEEAAALTLLELSQDTIATAETWNQLEKQFRKLSLQFHPDKNPGKNTEEKFKALVNAKDLLKVYYTKRSII